MTDDKIRGILVAEEKEEFDEIPLKLFVQGKHVESQFSSIKFT